MKNNDNNLIRIDCRELKSFFNSGCENNIDKYIYQWVKNVFIPSTKIADDNNKNCIITVTYNCFYYTLTLLEEERCEYPSHLQLCHRSSFLDYIKEKFNSLFWTGDDESDIIYINITY